MKKATRILTTILVLSIATALYCIIIAPLLEPVSKYQKVVLKPTGGPIPTQQIMTLFAPDDWEVKARHVEINNIHLFAGENSALTERSVNIDKCTFVIVNSVNPLKAIIVKCHGNINLIFAQPPTFQEQHADNRLLSGSITGKIHAFSKGDEENLSIETEDFYIDKDRILTKANVYFKYGRTQGIGSGMQIQLINHGLFGSPERSVGSGPILHKIENITLQKLQRLTIVPPDKKQKDGQNDNADLFSSPIELRCDGPFVFNALNKYASFEQNVSLIQTVSNKASNSIRCQHLYLYFSSTNRAEENQQSSDSTQKSDSNIQFNEWDLQLDRLQADGAPVVIEAPEYQTKILADRLIANVSPLSFELDSNQNCEIRYKNHTISTQNLIYKVGEDGRLGTLECNPGWISSQIDQNGKQVRIRWSKNLRLEPDSKYKTESIVSLQGGVRFEMENNNKAEAAILADNIFFWLTQKGTTSNGFGDLTLSRMQANENVIMTSNPITARVNTLQLWFESLDNAEQKTNNDGDALTSNASSLKSVNSYIVAGDLLQGKILHGQGPFQISELTLKDNIRIVQNDASSSGDVNNNRLELLGSQIQIFNLTLPSATASLIGTPAKIRYNNMSLTGTAIHVNRGASKIWMESGGEALFNMQKIDNESEPENTTANAASATIFSSAMTEPAKVKWSKSMLFQNDSLSFTGDVTLQRKDQFAQCDELSILLNKSVDFQNLNSEDLQKSLDVRYIVLNNSVKLENVSSENGITTAMDCLTTSKITIDMKNQKFVAEGPGRAMTQRKSSASGDRLASQLGVKNAESDAGKDDESKTPTEPDSDKLAAEQTENAAPPRSSQLINLSVDFQKRLEGSYAPNSLSTFIFSGRVEAVYSPIDEIGVPIKTFNLSELPPQAFTLKCTQMEIQTDVNKVAKSMSPEADNNSSDSRSDNSAFIASGGVTLEGAIYNAVADKITFEAKNGMITLEGDGQIPAQFFYQKVLGGRYNQASSSVIHYNTQTGAVQGEGIQEFSLFLSPKN